jgi:hypothetical protein
MIVMSSKAEAASRGVAQGARLRPTVKAAGDGVRNAGTGLGRMKIGVFSMDHGFGRGDLSKGG